LKEKERMEKQIKASLKEKDVLLKEIHHRVKNNMQIIISLMRLQARQITDKKLLEIFRVSQNRIRSMALIHERFYHSDDFSTIKFNDYIEQMIVHIFSSYGISTNVVELKMDFKEIVLDITKAVPCGMIINELVSNAVKHAFPGGKKGVVSVKLFKKGKNKGAFIVSDNGIGFPADVDFRNPQTLGLQIATDLVKQVRGEIELDRKGGTTFTVTGNL